MPGRQKEYPGGIAPAGVMGGFMQPGDIQVVTALADDGLIRNPRRRACIERGSRRRVALERGFSRSSKLADMGHTVHRVSGHERSIFGRGQIILRQPDTGVLWAGSDPRADGCAMTY
jgi:gamma-glutamyltranspeptidase/glutathione hydrolase